MTGVVGTLAVVFVELLGPFGLDEPSPGSLGIALRRGVDEEVAVDANSESGEDSLPRGEFAGRGEFVGLIPELELSSLSVVDSFPVPMVSGGKKTSSNAGMRGWGSV